MKALFEGDTYRSFKRLEILNGPGAVTIMPVNQFIETRDAAIKMM